MRPVAWSAALAGVLMFGCDGETVDTDSGDDTDVGTDTDTQVDTGPQLDPTKAYVRITDLVLDLGAVDLAVNGVGIPLAEDFPPGAGTPFLPVPPGELTVQFHKPDAGNGDGATGPVALDLGPFEVGAGGFYTVGGWGLASIGATYALFLQEDPTPAAAGMAKIRIVHTCVLCGPISVTTATASLASGIVPGQTSSWNEIEADVDTMLFIDLDGDGGPDWQLGPFAPPALDSNGMPYVAELYLIPLLNPETGQPIYVPGKPLVGVMGLAHPLDTPDGIVQILPPGS